MQRKPRSAKLIEQIEALKVKFPFFNAKQTDDFIKLIKAHAKEMDSYVSNSFKDMVQKRQAAKLVGLSQEAFKAQLNEYIAQQTAIFKRAQSMTAEDVKFIEQVNEKAKATRAAKSKQNDELNVDNLLK